MAESALFIGFGAPARARERQALTLYDELLRFYAERQERGQIASFEAVLLEPHGGDLGGFFLLRGDGEQLDRLRRDDDGLADQMALYGGQVEEQLSAG